MVGDDEALDFEPLAHRGDKAGARPGLDVVVLGDHATHDHAAEIVEPRINRALYVAADILEINVDAFWTGRFERQAKIVAPMFDARIKAQFFGDVAALVGAAGDADDTATVALGQLSGNAADCPRGRGDDNRLTRLRLADRLQADIGRKARHAEDAECG